MKWMHKILTSLSMIILTSATWSQGCSDPGICTIGALNSDVTKDSVSSINFVEADLDALLNAKIASEKWRFELASAYSRGQTEINIYQTVFKASVRIKEKMQMNLKLPYTMYFGELGNINGLGDLTLSLQNTIFSGKNKRFAYTLAVVVPTSNADQMKDGHALPMAYQTSLGSFNSVIGVSAAINTWSFSIGYQHSFGTNDNAFDPRVLTQDPTDPLYHHLNEERLNYAPGINLERGSDLAFRVEKRFKIKKRWSAVLGVLPLYRLQKSKVTGLDGNTAALDNTSGLTLNLTGGGRYEINKNWIFRANIGVPTIQRSVMADGLKRHFVGILALAYRIW